MGFLEILCIGVGLSADAVAVSMSNAMICRLTSFKAFVIAACFAFFQGLMPALGYFAAGFFISHIGRLANVLTLLILGFIGSKMITDAVRPEFGGKASRLTPGSLLAQGVATSLDAFAVGVSFAAVGVRLFAACLAIAMCTFVLCLAGIIAGRVFGAVLGEKAEILGGVILIAIGLKSLF